MLLSFDSFERVSENSPAAITICTPQHEILWANPAHAELFGYHPAALVARNCIELMHPDDRDAFRSASQDIFAHPSRRVTWDSRLAGPTGRSRWVQNTLSTLPGVGFVLYQHDIDARRSAETEHEERTSQFAASNARLKEFAYGAAHDLREPLRAIAACTDLLVRSASVSGNSSQIATFITSGVARMSALIDDMLSFATTGVQHMDVLVDLEAAVAQATQDLQPEIARTAASLVVGRLPTVPGIEIQFVRIFQNLIGNAIKYGGNQPIRIEISAELAGAKWIVAVRDNGVGIAVEHQAEIFVPFKRLENSGTHGTGIGLALTKKIIERLGGAIWVQSELGSGSTFLFSIPAPSCDTSMTKIQAA